jgi:hypothetical protein
VTKRAELADGRVLEFPDDTPMEVIQRVVKEQIAASKTPAPTSAPVAAASAAAPMPEKRKRLAETNAAISELEKLSGRVKPRLGVSGSAEYQLRALKMARDRLAEDIKEGPNTGFLSDLGSQFSAGVAGFDVGLGYLTGQDELEQSGRQSQRIAQEELSPLGQEVSQKGVLGSDMTMGERAYAASLGVSRSVPDLVGGAVAAAAIGAAAPQAAAAALGARVLSLAAKSPRVAKLFGITAGAGGREAALAAGRTVIGSVAGSGIEGVQGGLYAGSDTKAAVLEQIEADPEAFANSDIGKKFLAVHKGDMEAAKNAAAEQIGSDNALATGIATSLLSIPGSVFEARLLLGASSGKIGKELLIGTGAEALQEAPQSGAQQALSNLALQRAGSDVDTFEGVAKAAGEGAIVGGLMGGTLGGVGAVTKKLAGSAEAETETDLANSPQVEQEFYRLVTVETQALRDQNPDLTQRQAYNQVVKDAGKLYDTAILNTMLGAEGDIDVADADTGVDDFGGTVAGAATDIGTTPPPPGVTDVGETVGGGLERSVSSIPVSDVGEGAGVSPLGEAQQILANKKIKLTERVDVARQLLNDTILSNKLVNDIDQKQYDMAKNQLANGKHGGDPMAALEAVTGKKFAAPLDISGTVSAPTVKTAPSIDEVAVAPVADAIKSVTAPTGSAVPTLAQASAQQLGITPAPEVVAPVVEPTPAPPAPPAERTMNDMAGIGTVNPDNTNEVLVGGGGIQLTPLADNVLKVDSLRAVETGGGRKAMEQLTEVADANGTKLQLSPEPFAAEAGKEMTPTELTEWYRGFGFQEQPDGTMVRPAPTAASPTITPMAAATPQEILTDLENFAISEAQDRDFDQDAFLAGVDDIRNGREPMSYSDALKAYGLDNTKIPLGPSEGGDVALSRVAGAQWAQERVAEAQAAPTPAAEVASEVSPTATGGTGAPPAPPPPPTTTGGPSGPAPRKPKVVSNGKPVVLTEAQKRTALAKAKATREKMNRIQKRIAATNDTADVLSGGVDLAKLVRGDKENWALLRGAIDTVDVGRWQLILPTLSTEDIFRILKGRIPGLTEADRIIQQDVTRFQTKEYLRLADELEQVADFLKKYPKAAQALSDLEFATVAYQVDPTKAATPEEYAKLDKKTKELQTELGNVTVGDAKGKKKVEDKIARRLDEIKSVYVGVPGDERVIGWRDLSRPEFGSNKGKEIFKLLRDGHRRDLEAKYDALRSRLMETKKDEALDEALEKLEAQFKPALEQVIYFPAMRFGSYYARVGTGVNSIFKLFETQTQRNQFVRIMESRGEEVTETGNVEDLRDNFEQVTGGPLKEVLDLFEGDQKDIGALKSQVFDLWLQTMSAGDMRKHMAPRKMRAGYSTDILKNFANFRRSSTNDVKRAKFGYKLRTEISRAKDMVADMPDREKMNAFIKEIELRTLSDLMPPERGNPYWEAAIQFGNKAAFYQYLANPKTALIQLTQLHIVALPILAQKYGTIKANAALAKYGFSSLGGFVVSPLKAIKREDGSFTFDWEQPNLLDNPISALKEESDPELYEVLSEGWNEGRDLNIFMDTFANQIGGYGNADPQQRSALQELMRGRVHTAAWRGTTFAFEAMGTLMHQMERVNREATYMAALELAYRENKKKGQPHAEAKKNAIEAAADTTLAATFDFSSYNKPRVLNTGVGRLAGQFMSYPYMMTSLLARNMYTAIKVSGLEPGERKAAIQTTTGTLFNIGLYAGLTGVPLYGFFTTIASLLLWAFGDDEEEEGGLSYLDKDGNIKATYNIDWWVRNVWIPQTFGPDGTVANLFDLEDDTAEIVARSVEKGPISAITDIDLSNSVALDFLFFLPRESRAETPEGKVVDYTFSAVTGAAGNTVMDYIKAGKDLMNGYTDRALEKLPKLFSSIAKANRFATEGQTNYNRELVGMDKDFWSSDKVILQALSFASTEASQKQQQNYEAKSINVKIEKARADFLNKLRKTALDRYQYGVTPETEAAQQQIVKEWVEFNQTYPTHVIGLDSFYEVQNNAVNNAVESYGTRGLPMDPKGVKTPYLSDLYLRRLETEKQ